MMLLVGGATATVRRYAGHPHLGRFTQPRSGNDLRELATCGMAWAADNDGFIQFDPRAYLAMVDGIAAALVGLGPDDRARLKFITVPDAVGDARSTLAMWRQWRPTLAASALPAALVAQDGMEITDVPWPEVDALFIGGSTRWKLSGQAARLALAAKMRGRWVHVGRVNSARRERAIGAWGTVDSFDGGQYSMFPDTHIPACLRRLSGGARQLGIEEVHLWAA